MLALIAFSLAGARVRTALLVLASFHLHLLCDLAGSRGSSPVDLWPIPYLAPFASHPALVWDGQWPLTSWQNTTLTVLLLLGSGVIAVRRGHSPLELFSRRADAALVAVLRRRFGSPA